MTQFSKHEVINNLRDKVQKLEYKLKAVQDWWDLHNQCIGLEAAKKKLEEILGAEAQR